MLSCFSRFHRGQPIYVESKEFGKVGAVVSAVGTAEVRLRHSIKFCTRISYMYIYIFYIGLEDVE